MAVHGTDDPDGAMRASNKDREAVAAVLRDAYAVGRLNLDEFNERISAAYASKTQAELRVLTADLSAGPDLASVARPTSSRRAAQRGRTAPVPSGGQVAARQVLRPIRRTVVTYTTAALVLCVFMVVVVTALDYGFTKVVFELLR